MILILMTLSQSLKLLKLKEFSHLATKSIEYQIYIIDQITLNIISQTGHALRIWICGCILFYSRDLWASKSAGFNSTKSPRICGCKRGCPKDLRVCAPAACVLTHSLRECSFKYKEIKNKELGLSSNSSSQYVSRVLFGKKSFKFNRGSSIKDVSSGVGGGAKIATGYIDFKKLPNQRKIIKNPKKIEDDFYGQSQS